jgi:hypothetical protein
MLSELFYPHGGGAELATYMYAKLLSKRPGIRVTVVTNQFPGEAYFSKNEGFSIYRLPLLKNESMKYSILQRFDVLLSSVVRKLCKQSDIVYIPRYWISAIPLAKNLGKPVITQYVLWPFDTTQQMMISAIIEEFVIPDVSTNSKEKSDL